MRLSLVKSDGCGLGQICFALANWEVKPVRGWEEGRGFARGEGLGWLVRWQVRDRGVAEGRNAK